MKYFFVLLLVFFSILNTANAQKFKVDTLLFNGNADKYINIVILGDGYTASQQDAYITDATNEYQYLFAQSPWSHYTNYFNVFAIRVISAETGTKHPNTASDCASASVPILNANTYLGSTFDAYGIHRLLVANNISNISQVLAANFPNYDQVLIVVNTPYYGGSGGANATSSLNSASNEIVAHELGHSFGYLADEYWAGPQYAAEKPNMTQQSDPSLIKWKNWLTAGTGVGINAFAEDPSWYKPATNCKMQYLGTPYCSVCQEGLVEHIHSLVNPIVKHSPDVLVVNSSSPSLNFSLDELMTPTPNTLSIKWSLDQQNISSNQTSVTVNKLSLGSHQLTVTVIDTTPLVRLDNHSTIHLSSITWTITQLANGVTIDNSSNKITCSLFPNPASTTLNISVEAEHQEKVSVGVMTLDGKLLQRSTDGVWNGKTFTHSLNIESLASGTYAVVFTIGNTQHQQLFIKQ